MAGNSKSKILFIGGTGYTGKFLVEACQSWPPNLPFGEGVHSLQPRKIILLHSFKTGDLYDHQTLVNAIKQVDVVFSTVGRSQLADQDNIISAIGEAGNVKKFYPSEFGTDADRHHAVVFFILDRQLTLWEGKIGKTLETIYISEEQIPKQIQESSPPVNLLLSFNHSSHIKGDHTNFEIDSSFGVEASALHPGVKYTTVDECLNQLV
ncbi:unnamed protein product [Sphenostylis stenocarpa]|uniref:NmrA-like domain-containing protein n=1 Tax=Sphenostylis stenocarpa TaxID=92480 RepID=A0AA86SUK8_9FABA|nr:unnamed protein product [Sphenostylis stenocarpa]